MRVTKRQEQILNLLHENGYMSVESLSVATFTSPSSIRRDLTCLQNMYYVKRSHGGASILEESSHPAHLNNRMTKNVIGKRKIAAKAAQFIKDGMTIMLDGSSTASFLIPYIAKHKDVILFTNNMITAVNAINMGIETYCTGGCSVNNSAVLSGPIAYKMIEEVHTDILFFSSQSIDVYGTISDSTHAENYLRQLMIKNAKQRIFLCDKEKFNRKSLYTLVSMNDIDIAIFDEEWNELKADCKVL